MSADLLAGFLVLSIVMALSPGPAVLTVIAQAVRHGWRRSVYGTLGILSINALYFFLSALGVGAFIAASPRLHAVLRWGGIAYLAWTAIQSLRARPGAERDVAASDGTPRRLYLQAVSVQASNPKTIVYFVSLLAPFIDTGSSWPVGLQVAVLAVVSIGSELPILVGYGIAATHGRRLLPGSRTAAWESRIAGALLLAAAIWLALR